VDVSQDVQTALRKCISSGHTRLLVTEDENPDRVRGIVHASALADLLMREGPDASIEPIVHDAPIVPETKALDDLLAELQRAHTSMAVVVDEYDATLGAVRNAGHDVEPRAEHWGSPRAYVRDPAGNLVELMAFPPDRG